MAGLERGETRARVGIEVDDVLEHWRIGAT